MPTYTVGMSDGQFTVVRWVAGAPVVIARFHAYDRALALSARLNAGTEVA